MRGRATKAPLRRARTWPAFLTKDGLRAISFGGRRFCGAGTEWKQAADESQSRSCVATYEGAMAACKKQRDGTATGGADWSFTCGHVGDTCKKENPNEPMARRLETLG